MEATAAVAMETPQKALRTDLDERSIFALRAFEELLLLPVTDVKDPAGTPGGLRHTHSHVRARTHTNTRVLYLMLRS